MIGFVRIGKVIQSFLDDMVYHRTIFAIFINGCLADAVITNQGFQIVGQIIEFCFRAEQRIRPLYGVSRFADHVVVLSLGQHSTVGQGDGLHVAGRAQPLLGLGGRFQRTQEITEIDGFLFRRIASGLQDVLRRHVAHDDVMQHLVRLRTETGPGTGRGTDQHGRIELPQIGIDRAVVRPLVLADIVADGLQKGIGILCAVLIGDVLDELGGGVLQLLITGVALGHFVHRAVHGGGGEVGSRGRLFLTVPRLHAVLVDVLVGERVEGLADGVPYSIPEEVGIIHHGVVQILDAGQRVAQYAMHQGDVVIEGPGHHVGVRQLLDVVYSDLIGHVLRVELVIHGVDGSGFGIVVLLADLLVVSVLAAVLPHLGQYAKHGVTQVSHAGKGARHNVHRALLGLSTGISKVQGRLHDGLFGPGAVSGALVGLGPLLLVVHQGQFVRRALAVVGLIILIHISGIVHPGTHLFAVPQTLEDGVQVGLADVQLSAVLVTVVAVLQIIVEATGKLGQALAFLLPGARTDAQLVEHVEHEILVLVGIVILKMTVAVVDSLVDQGVPLVFDLVGAIVGLVDLVQLIAGPVHVVAALARTVHGAIVVQTGAVFISDLSHHLVVPLTVMVVAKSAVQYGRLGRDAVVMGLGSPPGILVGGGLLVQALGLQ